MWGVELEVRDGKIVVFVKTPIGRIQVAELAIDGHLLRELREWISQKTSDEETGRP